MSLDLAIGAIIIYNCYVTALVILIIKLHQGWFRKYFQSPLVYLHPLSKHSFLLAYNNIIIISVLNFNNFKPSPYSSQ